MATASETKVIEAYIGLLGRAPDPNGLAYWTAQLDAAGGTTDALKKLTNDITLSAEWDAGLGAQKQADGSISQANANVIVEQMYQNLFERAAKAADLTYWGDQLIDGTVTSSEMAVLLIAAANENGTADGQTLALKTEAATYYVENVSQEQFNRDSAGDSVSAVDSPNTLAASKAATDLIATDTGNDYVLSSTVTEATVVFTGATDTVTGTFGTGATYSGGDLQDISASDNDSLTLTGDASTLTFGTTKDIENISVNLSKSKVGGATIDMTAVTGTDATSVTMSPTVDIAGVTVTGETVLTIDDPRGDLTTTGVTGLTITNPSALAQNYTFDSALASFTQNAVAGAVNANDTNLVFANDSVTISLQGSTATNDAVSITVDNEASLTFVTNNVEDVTITGSNDAATVTLDVVHADSDDITYTLAGSNDVTLKVADGQELSDAKFTNAGTGDLGIILGGGTASNLDGFGTLGNGLTLAADSAFDLHLASGNTVTNTVTNTNATKIDANDGVTDTSSITLVLTNDTTGGLDLDNYETVVIDTDDSRLTSTGNIDLNGADATIGGSNDVTVGSLATGDVVSVVADDLIVGAISVMNDVTLVGQNDVTITSIATTQNDVDVDAGGDITTGAITANITTGTIDLKGAGVTATGTIDSGKGSVVLTATANDVVVTAVDAQNDITLKAGDDITATGTINSDSGAISIETTGGVAGNDVTVVTVTAQNDITLKGDDVTASNAITVDTANGGSVTITATNDINLSTDNSDVTSTDDLILTAGKDINTVADDPDLIAANDIVITAGNDIDMDVADATNMTATAGNITISGDQIEIEGEVKALAGTVTVAGNDSDQSDIKTVTALNLTVNDGNLLVDTVTLTGNLSVTGDADFQSGAVTAPVVALSSTNDVDITTLFSELVVGAGTGDYDLGTVSNGDADDADGVSITLGAGNDSMTLDDEAAGGTNADSIYTVNTGGGIDTVTIGDVQAGSIINTGAGNDIVSVSAGQTDSITVVTGDGADSLTIGAVLAGSFDMGNDVDTLDITASLNLTGSTVKNFEKLVLDAGATVIVDQAFLDNDSSYVVSGGAATIQATNLTSADMSGVTFDGSTTGVNFTAAAAGGSLTGTGNVDTLTGGAGNDTLTGGSGADLISGLGGVNTIVLTEGTAAKDVVTFGSGADSISGFVVGAAGTADDLKGDISDIEGNLTGTDLANTQGGSIGAEAMTFLTIAGATDIDATDANAIVINGNVATTDALETALEDGGGFELTAGTGGFAGGDSFLVIYDDGANTYVAGVSTANARANGAKFATGDLTAEILVTLTGVTDATTVNVANFADFVA